MNFGRLVHAFCMRSSARILRRPLARSEALSDVVGHLKGFATAALKRRANSLAAFQAAPRCQSLHPGHRPAASDAMQVFEKRVTGLKFWEHFFQKGVPNEPSDPQRRV